MSHFIHTLIVPIEMELLDMPHPSITSLGSARQRTASSPSALAAWCKRLVTAKLDQVGSGVIVLDDRGHVSRHGDPSQGPEVHIRVLDQRFFARCVTKGTLGFADAYIQGFWTTDDLPGLLRLFVRDINTARKARSGIASAAAVAQRVAHRIRSNTLSGSRSNIAAHYDLGNDLFEAMLDPTMTYSCGIFESPQASLQQASQAKLDTICSKLSLTPADRVVEIGTGWGSFAIHAARHYGCHVTTTTISQEQHDLASERVRAVGLNDRIDLRMTDYRDLQGQYDKLVSIEMIEAVGHNNLGRFFRTCSDLLRPGGEMLLQAISMPDNAYPQYLKNVDFIQQYVFPGSCCPSPGAIAEAIASSSDLKAIHLEDITPHYVRTLRAWRHNFEQNTAGLCSSKYNQQFRLMWEYYLAYCEAGFAEEYIATVQMKLRKQGIVLNSASVTV